MPPTAPACPLLPDSMRIIRNSRHSSFSGPFVAVLLLLATLPGSAADTDLLPALRRGVAVMTAESDNIPPERRAALEKISRWIRQRMDEGKPAALMFICTHNSRRSQLAQVWAQTAATYFGLKGITTYSGGVEVTACNPRTVAALVRAGFAVTNTAPQSQNPIYHVEYSATAPAVELFSKNYSAPTNPQSDFAAIMTCDHADQNCPRVKGCAMRAPLHYEDPKVADGSPIESETYDVRSRQIAQEMFFVMQQVRSQVRSPGEPTPSGSAGAKSGGRTE